MFFDEPDERVLHFKQGGSNKVYLIQMLEHENFRGQHEWVVKCWWGRQDSWSPQDRQEKVAAGRLAAEKEFQRILRMKMNKGYKLATRDVLPGGYPKAPIGCIQA